MLSNTMTFVLNCSTPTKNIRWILRAGERARIGKSPWIEFCIADDEDLAEEHFAATYTDQLSLVAIGEAQIRVAGQCVKNASIDSQTLVEVGQSTILFEPAFLYREETASVSPTTELCLPAPSFWHNKREIAELVALSKEGSAVVDQATSPWEAIEVLASHLLWEDAVRVLAGCLPTVTLIRWGTNALIEHHLPLNDVPMQQVLAWLNEPSDARRIAISADINWSENASPWTWILASISWTGGSLGSSSDTTVTPPQRMIVSAIIAALQLASCQTNRVSFCRYCVSQGLAYLASATTPVDNLQSAVGKEVLHATRRAC